ncbi:MAG: hypothetical protein ACRDI2_24885 [Chloroflexota bacterium]
MRFLEFATAVTAIGCGTGVIITTVDKVFSALGGRRGSTDRKGDALRTALEHNRQQTLQITELRRQNEQLQKQLEWHTRLLAVEEWRVRQVTTSRESAGGR